MKCENCGATIQYEYDGPNGKGYWGHLDKPNCHNTKPVWTCQFGPHQLIELGSEGQDG